MPYYDKQSLDDIPNDGTWCVGLFRASASRLG